jgi:hypothetical protein
MGRGFFFMMTERTNKPCNTFFSMHLPFYTDLKNECMCGVRAHTLGMPPQLLCFSASELAAISHLLSEY